MRAAIFILSVIVVFSCGREESPTPKSERAKTSDILPESLATLSFKTFLDGTPPVMPTISMSADQKCAALHQEQVKAEQVVLGDGGTLQNVFVYIKEGLEDRTFPLTSDTVVLDQQGCMYKPRVVGLQVNQTLLIVNSDPTLHNIHALPQINRGFNIAQPRRGMKTERTFTRPEVMIRVKCDVHPWMASYIGVLNHPYFAVSGTDGAGGLRNVPAGEYVVAAWHERYGEQEQRITLSAADEKTVEFRFVE
jgi:hypothetical protein